ncbi:hypothetical protein [Streptomyces chattanoogensis]|uniref:hypothetical protein n=1 Tax=Streptomyces chattanoogensis TaxID=66876 RepID=UPI0036A0DDC1
MIHLTFTYEGKVVLRERLLTEDPMSHAYRHSVEAASFPITGYEATLTVHPHKKGDQYGCTAGGGRNAPRRSRVTSRSAAGG